MSYASNFGVVPEPVYATVGARLAACLIDCAIVWYAVQAALGGLSSICRQDGLLDAHGQITLTAVARPVALLVYFTAFEGGVGATIGKMMMQLRVRGTNGHPVGFGRAAGRNLAKALSVLTLGLAFLPAMFLDRRQTLYDIAATCVVVRAA